MVYGHTTRAKGMPTGSDSSAHRVSPYEAVEKVIIAREGHPERSRGISKTAQIFGLEILRSALNEWRTRFSTATYNMPAKSSCH